VGAPHIEAQLQTQIERGEIDAIHGEFKPEWLDQAFWLVVAATNDDAVNQVVAEAAEARRLFVNVVDDARRSSVQLPAIVDRGHLQIAISSGGGAPMLARHLRRQLESWFDSSWGALAQLLTEKRALIRQRLPELGPRRSFFERLLAGPIQGLLRQRQFDAAQQLLQNALERPQALPQGSVTLVGAGSGDPGLITLNALRALNRADVILHDRLVSAEVLQLARRDAHFIEVGKTGRGPSTSQDAIHGLMLEHARAGRHVVRLKGGDAFIFGRGGEELQFLRQHGIRYEVVPGITAALACAAYAGIPLTHREHAQEVRLVSAHTKDALTPSDWLALAQPHQTLVFYMGVGMLERIRAHLLDAGLAAHTPVALVENGSHADQRVAVGDLHGLCELAAQHAISTPALLIVGDVAALATQLHWFGAPPLQATAAKALSQAA
ncbi:MAG: uroporphyrinogen-III C-methyltransferase, partial [Xanthomonadales bacterium]|nr:uroporphyrinogen-III C-methyltransferase [Xanthomonadales bacterium]